MPRKREWGTQIKKWLENEGFNVHFIQDKKFDFVLEIRYPNDKKMGFSISKAVSVDMIVVNAGILCPKEVVDLMKKLKVEEKNEIIQPMHRELLKMVQDHKIEDDLTKINVLERVYPENNLSRQQLMDSFLRARNANQYLMSVIRKLTMQDPEPPSTDINMYG